MPGNCAISISRLLIFDEVQVGCGRLGTIFGHQVEGVVPDAMALAKGLVAGCPWGQW